MVLRLLSILCLLSHPGVVCYFGARIHIHEGVEVVVHGLDEPCHDERRHYRCCCLMLIDVPMEGGVAVNDSGVFLDIVFRVNM